MEFISNRAPHATRALEPLEGPAPTDRLFVRRRVRANIRARQLGGRRVGFPSDGRGSDMDLESVLYHVSEDENIKAFRPRSSPIAPQAGPIVWAIDAAKLPNYLLPRDCPRVTFGVAETTSRHDCDRFGVHEGRVVVIEAGWLSRVCACTLFLYELRPQSFRLFDECAGYWVSSEGMEPIRLTTLTDLPTAITERGAELRVVRRLWPLHDTVTQSTLAFSMIRMRKALK